MMKPRVEIDLQHKRMILTPMKPGEASGPNVNGEGDWDNI